MSPRCWPTLLSRRAADSARLARLFALVFAAAILLVAGGAGQSQPSIRLVADTPAVPATPDRVAVQITAITPLSPGPKDTLRISGRVVVQSGGPITHLQVSLHLGPSVASRTELQGLRANPVAQELATPNPQDVGNGELSAGHPLTFTISTPMSALDLPRDGVYPMQVLATGREDGDTSSRDLTTVSTFLPYITQTEATPATPIAWVVPLTANPSLLADGSFENTRVVSSVAPNGRLRQLLDGLSAAKVATATLDPATIRELSLAANSRYTVVGTPTSRAVTNPASTDAKNWLADLRAAGNVGLIGLPYADPDVEALVHDNHTALADDAVARAKDVLSLGLLTAKNRLSPGIAIAPAGQLDLAGATYYSKQTDAKAVVVTGNALAAAGDNPSAVADVPGVPTRLLLTDDVVTKLVSTGPLPGARIAEQEILAELAESHLEDRATSGKSTDAARPLLIAPASGWSPPASWLSRLLTDTGRLPWLQQVPIGDLLSAPAQSRTGLQYPAATKATELPPELVDNSAQVATATEGLFRTAKKGDPPQTRNPQSIVQPILDAALVSVSSRWRSDPTRSTTFRENAQRTLASLQQQVRVVASPQVTLTSRSGRVPVTLENDLGAAVDVSLVLTSLDESRVSSGTVVTRTVPAGQKVQVEVEVKAASAGTFPVRLQLFTPSGQLLGTPAQVLVRSTTYGVVATVFTVVALSVLGLAVLFRSIRALVRRSRRRNGQPEPA